MKVIMIESDLIQVYYKQPTFSDYFNLLPCHILFWDYSIYFIQAPFPYGYNLYYRDSITDVAIYADSIIYTYDRMVEDTDMVITQTFNKHMYFFRDNISPLVETAPDWYAYGNISELNWGSPGLNWNQYWSTVAMTITIDSLNADTITTFTLDTFGASLYLPNCSYSEPGADYYNGITVD